MNVTALEAVIKHWKPVMVTLLAVRCELYGRLERIRNGWTGGDMHLFSGLSAGPNATRRVTPGTTASTPQPVSRTRPQLPHHPGNPTTTIKTKVRGGGGIAVDTGGGGRSWADPEFVVRLCAGSSAGVQSVCKQPSTIERSSI